jgi:hypothetical protein
MAHDDSSICIIEEQSLAELIYAVNDKAAFVLEEIVKVLGVRGLQQLLLDASPPADVFDAYDLGKMLEQALTSRNSLRRVVRENEGWQSEGLH